MNWNNFCKEFYKKIWKKIILGTSDAWLTSHSSQGPSVLYWRLSDSYYRNSIYCGISSELLKVKVGLQWDKGKRPVQTTFFGCRYSFAKCTKIIAFSPKILPHVSYDSHYGGCVGISPLGLSIASLYVLPKKIIVEED